MIHAIIKFINFVICYLTLSVYIAAVYGFSKGFITFMTINTIWLMSRTLIDDIHKE